MRITDKINFRQPKYMLPAILYLPLLFFGYFFFRFFNIEKVEVDDKKQTTAYYNDKLPDANLKGDGIGDKYSNMVNNFGKIKDESAVENIERGGEEQKESYQSQYTDAEVAALDRQSDEARQSMERLRRLQEQIKEQQQKDNNVSGSHYRLMRSQRTSLPRAAITQNQRTSPKRAGRQSMRKQSARLPRKPRPRKW